MSKIRLEQYVPKNNDVLLLDTNILIALFYPIMIKNAMTSYQKLYANAIKNKSILILPAIQVSEFINRCIRFSYDLYRGERKISEFDYKRDYRITDDYRKNMESILDIVKQDILSVFLVVDDYFSEMPQEKIYRYGFSYDFNDALLVQIAEKQGATLVTHDADFGNYVTKANIVTSNPKLLMFS